MRRTAAGSKVVKPASIVLQQLSSNSIRDIITVLQIPRSSFGSVRVRIVGRVHEQILTYFFHHATEKRFVSITAEEDPARLQVIAGRAANEIPGVITRILKVIIHALQMGGNPTDASFQEGKLEIRVAVQKAGTEHAGEPGHDREYAGQDPIRKVVLKQLVDQGKLQAEVYSDGQIQLIGLGEERVVVGMIKPLRAGGSIDHHRRHA